HAPRGAVRDGLQRVDERPRVTAIAPARPRDREVRVEPVFVTREPERRERARQVASERAQRVLPASRADPENAGTPRGRERATAAERDVERVVTRHDGRDRTGDSRAVRDRTEEL